MRPAAIAKVIANARLGSGVVHIGTSATSGKVGQRSRPQSGMVARSALGGMLARSALGGMVARQRARRQIRTSSSWGAW